MSWTWQHLPQTGSAQVVQPYQSQEEDWISKSVKSFGLGLGRHRVWVHMKGGGSRRKEQIHPRPFFLQSPMQSVHCQPAVRRHPPSPLTYTHLPTRHPCRVEGLPAFLARNHTLLNVVKCCAFILSHQLVRVPVTYCILHEHGSSLARDQTPVHKKYLSSHLNCLVPGVLWLINIGKSQADMCACIFHFHLFLYHH